MIRARDEGFTLIEVVVALAILATTLYGGFFLLNRTTVNSHHLRDTVLANWVAANAYAYAVLGGDTTDSEPQTVEQVMMYGEEFLVTVNRENEDATTRQEKPRTNDGQANVDETEIINQTVIISVAKSSSPDSPLENVVVYQ